MLMAKQEQLESHSVEEEEEVTDPSRTLSEYMYTCIYYMCEDECVECDSDTPPLPAAIDDLFEVKMTLQGIADNWKKLGLALGLLYSTLKKISTYPNMTIDNCVMEMLAAWLQKEDNVPQKGVPSWSVLQAALRRLGENELAHRISIGGELSW